MKKLIIGGLSILLLGACQDLVELNDVAPASLQTRSVTNKEYYWFKKKKIALNRDSEKCYVLFHSSKSSTIFDKLEKMGLQSSISEIEKYNYSGTDNSGELAETMSDYYCATIKGDYKRIQNIQEFEYVAPYGIEDGNSFPVTNIIYAYVKNDADFQKLLDDSKKIQLGYVGKSLDIPNLYLFECTKESKGDAVYCANQLYENGDYDEIQPAFISFITHSSDPNYSHQWNLENTGQEGANYIGIDINFNQSSLPQTNGIVVGVVDTGVDLSHSDLNVNSFSWNSKTGTSPSICYDPHGTKVAGVIGAKANAIGNIGVAPGISIMSFSNEGSAGNSTFHMQLATSIRKAVDKGCAVINNSWGIRTWDANIENAISYAITNGRNGKGTVLVFATGNSNDSILDYPARHTPEKEILAVGAISYNGKRKSPITPDGEDWGSNYGTGLDIMAPGVSIPTTTINNGYVLDFNGTSAAAAHVSAAAALVIARNPELSYEDVIYILERSANKSLNGYTFSSNNIGGTWNDQVGYGLLDLSNALTMAFSTIGTPNTLQMYGNSYISRNNSDYAYSVLSMSPNSSYNYIWSVSSTFGDINRYYLYPSNNGYGYTADLGIYLNSNFSSGTVVVNCRVYNGSTYMGCATKYIYVN